MGFGWIACTAVAGSIIGQFVGVLPGIGPVITALAITQLGLLSPEMTITIVICIYVGAQFSSSTPAILLGIPGEASSTTTAQAGRPLTLSGSAPIALRAAAIGSLIGTTLAMGFMAALSYLGNTQLSAVGDLDVCMIVTLSMLWYFIVSAETPVKSGLFSLSLGITLGLVGLNPFSGAERLTFGISLLRGGFEPTMFLTGFIALPALLSLLIKKKVPASEPAPNMGTTIPLNMDVGSYMASVAGSILGFVFGAMPGIGPSLGTPLAVSAFKGFARKSQRLKYDLNLVACGEAANNAAAVGSFFLLLSIGLPSNSLTAILEQYISRNGIYFEQPGNVGPSLLADIAIALTICLPICYFSNVGILARYSSRLIEREKLFSALGIAIISIGIYASSDSPLAVTSLAAGYLCSFIVSTFKGDHMLFTMAFILTPLLEQKFGRMFLLIEYSALPNDMVNKAKIYLIVIVIILFVCLVRRRKNEAIQVPKL